MCSLIYDSHVYMFLGSYSVDGTEQFQALIFQMAATYCSSSVPAHILDLILLSLWRLKRPIFYSQVRMLWPNRLDQG